METKYRKVDFMCIGAPKAGTTWLYKSLNQHPRIFIPPQKELHYFNAIHPETLKKNPNADKGLDWYHSHFKEDATISHRADFSTSYLRDKAAAKRLFEYNPDLKIIVMLRNPVDRAWSHYNFLLSRGMIKSGDFYCQIQNYPHILEQGEYSRLLTKYFELFDRSKIRIVLYQELENPESLLNSLYEFLNIESYSAKSIHDKVNKTQKVINPYLHQKVTVIKHSFIGRGLIKIGFGDVFNKFYSLNTSGVGKEGIPDDIQKYLFEYYQADVESLSKMINKDIDYWKKCE